VIIYYPMLGLLALTVALSSCALSPLAKRSAAFGNAATVVVRDSSNAYDTVERVTYQTGVSFLVLDFDRSGFDRSKIKPFLSIHDLESRQRLLRGLQVYAEGLADVAGTSALVTVDDHSKTLSEALVKLSDNAELKSVFPAANESTVKGIATAIDTLAKILIERKRRKELPNIVGKMETVLERLCGLFDEDIGTRPENGHSGRGLRNQLWNEYDNLIGNQTDYIAISNSRLTPAEKASEIAKLPQLVSQQQSADAALAATQRALRQLVITHRALVQSTDDSSFRSRLYELIGDGEEIAAFYSSLQTKGKN